MSTLLDIDGNSIDPYPLLEKKPIKKSNKPKIILILVSTLILVGKNYCYNIPQSLETHFLNGTMRLTNLQFDLFYSVYSFPNIILPFFGGIFIDKMGNRISLLFFCSLIVIGQFIFLLGTTFLSYFLLILGRVLFGLGSETLLIVQHTIIVKWADKNELALAIALQAAMAKIGAIINSPITPILYRESQGFFLPNFVGVLFCLVSFIAGVFVCFIDKRYEGRLEKIEEKRRTINLKVLIEYDSRFWLLTLQGCLIFGSYTAFTANENHILSKLFNMSSETAGIYLMIIYVISIIFPPIMGIFTDKYGRKPSLLLIVNICFIACIIILIFLPSDCNHLIIIIPMILHGIFLSCFFPIVWTCIPMIVKLNSLGTAYGVLSSFVNSNQAVSPIIFGVIEDKTKSNYFWALVFVAFQAVIALYATVGVWISDYKNGEVLEKAKK